jgi:hypothetical protein
VAIPEYKIGPRWEPSPYATIALTYGHEFAGSLGAGFEFGVMLSTPRLHVSVVVLETKKD